MSIDLKARGSGVPREGKSEAGELKREKEAARVCRFHFPFFSFVVQPPLAAGFGVGAFSNARSAFIRRSPIATGASLHPSG